MEIPAEILAEIEKDVQRYREMRINAARKRLSPEQFEKQAKYKEQEWIRGNQEQIVRWFASGESIQDINSRFRFIGKNRIRQEIRAWMLDALRPADFSLDSLDWDKWPNPPRFSEAAWRSKVRELIP
jgi:hypothetical protein